jgi:tetratricopeptide (TPR) repeat protein
MECKGCGAALTGDPLSRSWTCAYCATVTVNEKFLSVYIHQTDFTAAHHLLQSAMAAFDSGEYEKAFVAFDKVIATDSACVDAWAYGAVAAARLATAQNFEQQARTTHTWLDRARGLDPAGDVVVVSDGVCREALSKTAYRSVERNLREGNTAYFAYESTARQDAIRRRTECFERAFVYAEQILEFRPTDSAILGGTVAAVLKHEPLLPSGHRQPALVAIAREALEHLRTVSPGAARSIDGGTVADKPLQAADPEQVRREQERATAERKRAAEERRRKLALGRDRVKQALLGTRERRRAVAGVCALGLLAAGVTAWRLNAPPPRPTDIVWSGQPEDCFNPECLRVQMQKTGASLEAVEFAAKLTAARENAPTWAIGLANFGRVDLVSCDDVYGRGGGYTLVDGELRLVRPIDNATLARGLEKFSPYVADHPNAMVMRGQTFVGQTRPSSGRARFTFQSPVGDCEACEPAEVILYGAEFDDSGRHLGSYVWKVLPWSGRMAPVAIGAVQPGEASIADSEQAKPSVPEAVVQPRPAVVNTAPESARAATEQPRIVPPVPVEHPPAVAAAGKGDLRGRIRQIATRIDKITQSDLLETIAGIESEMTNAPPQRSTEARRLNDEGLAALKRGELANAVSSLQRANAINPRDTEIAENLGYAEWKSDSLEAAQKHLIASILMAPRRASSWASLGVTLATDGKIAEATVCFLEAFTVTRSRDASRRFFSGLATGDPNASVREASGNALKLFDSPKLFSTETPGAIAPMS